MSTSAVTPAAGVDRRDAFWLRFALAFIWLATGLGVLHPYYREVGEQFLGKLGLPPYLMTLTCIFEVLLGVRLLLAPAGTWLILLQAAMIVAFTGILGITDPRLLVDPFGVLTKNVPLLGLLAATWLVEREGWTSRARWTLRAGMASIWVLEGLLPCLLFPQSELREMMQKIGRAAYGSSQAAGVIGPGWMLWLVGGLEVLSGVAALVLRGWALRLVLLCQLAGLGAISAVLVWWHPWLLAHPFGPVTKNVPIFIGTLVALRRQP